jgi:hypothetical protein
MAVLRMYGVIVVTTRVTFYLRQMPVMSPLFVRAYELLDIVVSCSVWKLLMSIRSTEHGIDI